MYIDLFISCYINYPLCAELILTVYIQSQWLSLYYIFNFTCKSHFLLLYVVYFGLEAFQYIYVLNKSWNLEILNPNNFVSCNAFFDCSTSQMLSISHAELSFPAASLNLC